MVHESDVQTSVGTPIPRGSLFSGVDHVAIAVTYIDEAIATFSEKYRLALLGSEIAEDPGVRLAYLDGGNVSIQLVQPVREGPISSFLREHGPGLHHVCFTVDDIQQTLDVLDGEVSAPIFRGGRDRTACFLLDKPHGTLVELTERTPRAETTQS